jgi:acyl-CoA thioester hydrolase
MRYQGNAHVRWDDLDAFGHVNNATYLTYAQEARSNFLWFSKMKEGEAPVVQDMVIARAEVDFILPIYRGSFELDVTMWISKIGTSSFTMEYELRSEAGLHSRIKTVQVAINKETQRSRPLSDPEREFLGRYLEAEV